MSENIHRLLQQYGDLLQQVDQWFSRCQALLPEQIRCGQGCSGCCRALFDVTLLDAWYLRLGYARLSAPLQQSIRELASARLAELRQQWPDFAAPYLLNYRPEAEWELLMPDEDETPCVFLDDGGHCLVYEHRPMTCRLHGLPLVDDSGEVLVDEWCTDNFTATNPLLLPELRAPFNKFFRAEVKLMQQLTGNLFMQQVNELDTFIPLAALVDYGSFDWLAWKQAVHLVVNDPVT